VTPQALNTSFQSFAIGDTTTKKTLFTAGANGSLLNCLLAQSSDTVARNILLYYYDLTTYWPIGCVNIPINSGNTGAIASVNLLTSTLIPGLPLDSNGNPYIKVKATHQIVGAMLTTVTTALQVTISALGEDL
jgi:hypothetical protein